MEHFTPLTIIVADDDQDDRELLKHSFRQNDKFVLAGCLTSGIEVFEEIARKKNIPDILLIDMYMPFFTGVEVVAQLEKSNAAPNMIKFIISTAINATEQDKHIGNPSVIFLKKPITPQEIDALPALLLEHLNKKNHNIES